MDGLKENLKSLKEEISRLEDDKRSLNIEYETAMTELRKVDGEFRSLREK